MTPADPRIARLITLIRAARARPREPGGSRWHLRLAFCAMRCSQRACLR